MAWKHRQCQRVHRDVMARNWKHSYVPTPETEPDAIARDQRRAVREALKALPGATGAELSDAVDLPLDIVRRRLTEVTHGGRDDGVRGVPALSEDAADSQPRAVQPVRPETGSARAVPAAEGVVQAAGL